MTVTDLILNFRSALVAVLPMVEALGIPWRRGEAYDEWDNLASCMYRQLVGAVIDSSLGSVSEAPVRLAAYDMMLLEYAGHATVDVKSDELGHGRWVFHAFCTKNEPLDSVEVRLVSSNGMPYSEELRSCALSGCCFSVTLTNGSSISDVFAFSETP